ncbi:MAG: CxxC-x17-CxxC domain-containing protein [Candidatus Woesearchaeota archaeon]
MRTFKKPSRFGGRDSGFKKPSRFGGRDSDRSSDRSDRVFKKFDGKSSGKFSRHSERSHSDEHEKKFIEKESRSGNGFKLHEAVCDRCGQKCDLPFKPTGNKPIYCRSCFRETKGSSEDNFRSRGKSGSRFEHRGADRFDREPETKEQPIPSDALDKINRKLDKIMKALNID